MKNQNNTNYLPSEIPSPRQLEYQDWEFGIFFHFGIRTFYEGHRDWDGKPMPLEGFNPSELDCGQWISEAKDAGMRYAIFVCKHHDGFANWPSKDSKSSVAHTPWKDGKGDVVREFTEACRKHDMKVGLYYSPAEWGENQPASPEAYDEHFIIQISELLANYGEIDLLWFDGCGSEDHEYDWPRIAKEIRRLQPNLLIFNMGGDPDFRWVGNEDGLAPRPLWNTVTGARFSVNTEGEDTFSKNGKWLPAECDCMMRFHNWFFEEADTDTVKSVEELIGLYELSVGRGANLLLNIGPDRRGLLPDADRDALHAFGQEIRKRYGQPYASVSDFKQDGTVWTYQPEKPFLLESCVLEEDLRHGEQVRKFKIEIQTAVSGQWILLYEGRNIGHKSICKFPVVKVRSLRITLTQIDHLFPLRSISLYRAV